jgi:hypothetical protein
MKPVSPSTMHGVSASPLQSSVPGKGILEVWIARLLDALHESRRRQALRVISDNSHLLATPEQIASVMKVAHEAKPMPTDTDKQTSATGSWVSVMMSRSAAVTVVVVAVFVLHVIVAATLLDSTTSSAGHAPPIIHTD